MRLGGREAGKLGGTEAWRLEGLDAGRLGGQTAVRVIRYNFSLSLLSSIAL
jgi:hypothetical protein